MILRSLNSESEMRVNHQFEEQIGFTGEQLKQNKLLEWIHPSDQKALSELMDSGHGSCSARHRSSFGEWIPFEWTAKNHQGNTILLGLASSDSISRAPSFSSAPGTNSASSTHSRSSTPSSSSDDQGSLPQTLESMVHILESKNPGLRCSILLLDDENQYVSVGAGPSLPAEYNQAVEGLRIGPFVGSCGTAAFWNTSIVVENIAEDPLWKELRDAAKHAGVAACWSHPVTATNGDVLGAMALYCNEPSSPAQFQMDGLEVAARMVGLAIERDRLEGRMKVAVNIEALAVLAGGIAHEFNNILSSILGNTQLIAATLDKECEAQVMLADIEKSSQRATELCDQMLTYSGRGAFTVETFDCNELIRELNKMWTPTMPCNASLTYSLSEAPLGIRADKSQMQQLVINLITNACEAMGPKQGRISISTSTRNYSGEELRLDHPHADLNAGPYVLISVSDTGGGMPASAMRRAFDPFFTTKSANRGLGLTAVQGIVQKHNGAIELKVDPGVGSTLSVLLPQVSISVEEPVACLPAQPRGKSARIMIVDDEEPVRTVTARMLHHGKYETVLASNGAEAIEIYRREGKSIDCVILDLSMPDLDGSDVYFELRKIDRSVRVILSSGFTEQQIMIRFQNAGLAGILKKPATLGDLLDKVTEVLAVKS